MTLFLTSSPSGCPFEPGPEIPVLDERNQFVANLRNVWPEQPPHGLLLAADPEDYTANDQMCWAFGQSFRQAGLPLADLVVCDRRNEDEISQLLEESGFVMLCGGHVPTQNAFFSQLGLPALIQQFHGIIVAVSAGSMNAARVVYAQPELPGEAADPDYQRWLPGLGLTDTRIWPHYQHSKDLSVDGQSLMEIGLADGKRRPFLALPDGSYILCADGHETLYGEGWYFGDGRAELINENDQVLPLR